MIKVIDAKANEDFTLDIKFSDGAYKRFNFEPYLDYEVFRELRDRDNFMNVRVAFGTVQWPGERDISPETLYLEGIDIAQDDPAIAA